MKHQIAKILDQAAVNAQAIPQMAAEKNFNLKEAYEIQKLAIQERIKRGENQIGYKLGFTSKEKMEQMGVHDLIWGILTNTMQIQPNESISLAKYIHPRAEPEIAFLVKKDITQKISLEEIPEFIASCAPAIEIIDSRYQNFKFSLEDVVADNCSSIGFVIGKWTKIPAKISSLSMKMYFNQTLKQEGLSSQILENPLHSIIELSRLATQDGITINKGQIILAGAATAAEFIPPNTDIHIEVEELGNVKFTIKQ